MNQLLAATALALTLAACSQAPEKAAGTADTTAAPAASTTAASGSPTPAVPPSPSPRAAALTLDGLGELRLGREVPAGRRWAERGAQASDVCRTVSSPDYPGVYAIVEGAKVRRVTVGQNSDVELVEGIGVGASEAQVRAAFVGVRATPHKYQDAPAKYLTAPGATATNPALRFEIGEDGKVSLFHVGLRPQLEYAEGCA